MKHSRTMYCPEIRLREHLQNFWSIDETVPHKNFEECLMPLGRMELLYVEKPYIYVNRSGELQELKGWVLMGQRTKAVFVRSIDQIKIFGLRFRAWGLYNLIKIPLDEFKDRAICLSEVSPALACELDEIIFNSHSNFKRIALLQNLLLSKFSKQKPHPMSVVENTLTTMLQKGRFTVLEHAEAMGISHKNLNRTFRKFTGLTMKEYHRIIRLRRIMAILKSGKVTNWASLAASNDFCDQAHFIKEFRNYTGCTPIEYFQDRNTRFFNIL